MGGNANFLSVCARWLAVSGLALAVIGCSDSSDEPTAPQVDGSDPNAVDGSDPNTVDGSDPNAVNTTEGAVLGESRSVGNGSDMRAWLGIPYARSPSGERRFAAPQPPNPRSEILQVKELADACPQTPQQSPFAIQNTNQDIETSEDCLNLNIFAPSTGDDDHPVMVWFHGGGLDTGAGAQSGGNPDRLVDQGVVVVTVNYRLGLLGYLAHPALTDSSTTDQAGSGNYGLMDQIRALEWVQDNIENFGGDASNVTVFGESAGGFSIKGLMAANERTEGLFQRAIIQSGPSINQETLDEAEARGGEFMSGLCPNEPSEESASCLRDLSTTELLSAQIGPPEFDASIIQRPGVLEQPVGEALAFGQFTADQILEGTNRDEWRLFVAAEQFVTGRDSLESRINNDQAYQDELISRYGFVTAENIGAVVSAYPLSDFDNADLAVSAVGTDPIFACRGFANILASAQRVPVYAYEFADRDAPLPDPRLAQVEPTLGAGHATEIPYVLAPATSITGDFTDDSASLADAMVRYWASFARDGDPNPSDGSLPMWEPFPDQGYQSLEAPASDSAPFSALRGSSFAEYHNCSLWSGG